MNTARICVAPLLLTLVLPLASACGDEKTDDEAASSAASSSAKVVPAKAVPKKPTKDAKFLGLNAREIDGWKPVWREGASGVKWESPADLSHVFVRIVPDDLSPETGVATLIDRLVDNMLILKNGETPTETKLGWHTVFDVVGEKGAKQFVYVRAIEGVNTVCTASLTASTLQRAVDKALAIKICESY